MKHLIHKRLATVAGFAGVWLALAAGATAANGSTRPDDRATHGPGAVLANPSIASVRPDDRATHGPGAVLVTPSITSVRPDDRAVRPSRFSYVTSTPTRPDDRADRRITVEPIVAPATTGDGFDWADAAVGAGFAAGIALLVAAGLLTARRRRTLAHA